MTTGRANLAVRHSIAPRVLDNTVPMRTLTSTARFSVRVEPQRDPAACPVSADAPILATFVWKDSGAHVQLAGSFDDWRKHDMTFVPGVGYFVLVVELPPGEYYYRFVVDGRWRVAEGDCNLREDPFGEMSHHLAINAAALETTTPSRFSTAALTRVDLPRHSAPAPTSDDEEGAADGGGGGDADAESSDEEGGLTGDEGGGGGDEYAQVEPERLPRQQGDEFINDYADDAYGELDLQADVYEAMFDVKEEMSQEQSQRLLLPPAADARAAAARAAQARRRRRPTKKLLRSVFARLFGKDVGESADGDDAAAPAAQGGYTGLTLASDDILRQVDRAQKAKGKSRLRVWFPTERNFPTLRGGGRRVAPQEAQQVLDVGGTALRFNLAEENASSRQQLGKALFAQGKYDAALAMFSLSVKIREDNGLRNAKTSAIAHTDVASSFIHLGDLRNAEKHLNVALEVYDKNTFSGGRQELGDVHCFLAVVAEMRGTLPEAEASYRRAIALYEEGGATKKNPNYTTARENLRDNLRRQRDGPALAAQQQEQRPAGEDASPVSTVDSDHATDKENSRAQQNAAAVYKPTPRSAIKSILRQSPGMKPLLAGPTPQTLSTINSFPGTDTMESACHGEARNTHSGARLSNSQLLDPASLASAPVHTAPDSMSLPPALDEFRRTAEFGGGRDGGGTPSAVRRSHRRSSRPTTWRALAEVARASMPTTPIDEADGGGSDGGEDSTLGSYEEMSRGWQRDGRKFLVEGSYTEAIDMYTLAIYTRKRHGPWSTKANAETHVEYARALFASKDVAGAAGALRDAITILEKLDSRKHDMMLGQVWGNFGSALDRLGGRALDAETAHSTGLVALTRAGLAKDAPPWAKAWKNLCVSVKAQGDKAKPIEKVWFAIDQQIRGVVPITSAATIKV